MDISAQNGVLREVRKHVSIPVTFEVCLEIRARFPFLKYDDPSGVVEVCSPVIVNATLLCVSAVNERLTFDQRVLPRFRRELNDSGDNDSRHTDGSLLYIWRAVLSCFDDRFRA